MCRSRTLVRGRRLHCIFSASCESEFPGSKARFAFSIVVSFRAEPRNLQFCVPGRRFEFPALIHVRVIPSAAEESAVRCPGALTRGLPQALKPTRAFPSCAPREKGCRRSTRLGEFFLLHPALRLRLRAGLAYSVPTALSFRAAFPPGEPYLSFATASHEPGSQHYAASRLALIGIAVCAASPLSSLPGPFRITYLPRKSCYLIDCQ